MSQLNVQAHERLIRVKPQVSVTHADYFPLLRAVWIVTIAISLLNTVM